MKESNLSATDRMLDMQVRAAKKGVFFSLGGGALWGLDAVVLGSVMMWAYTRGVVDNTVYMLPLIFAMLHDAKNERLSPQDELVIAFQITPEGYARSKYYPEKYQFAQRAFNC